MNVQWLTVEVTTLGDGAQTVLDAKLFQEIKPAACTWALEDADATSRRLVITLEKKVAMRWIMLTRPEGLGRERVV